MSVQNHNGAATFGESLLEDSSCHFGGKMYQKMNKFEIYHIHKMDKRYNIRGGGCFKIDVRPPWKINFKLVGMFYKVF